MVANHNEQRLGALLAAALLLLGLTSCSGGPARIHPPDYSAAAIADAALAALDSDGDGRLSEAELQQCPAMLRASDRYDSNGDGAVDAGEIRQRVEQWSREGRTGVFAIACQVTLDGAPLAGAIVHFEPESFLGAEAQGSSGVTDARGRVYPALLDDPTLRGVQPGLFRIRIEHPQTDIPERYNQQSELGLEVSDAITEENIVFELVSTP